ncbi:hypothetical protein G6F22_018768 [Rhizopus arrhizus]|nr:hypothetical protein G6F22_018768 [Rhizopus arrhizus]
MRPAVRIAGKLHTRAKGRISHGLPEALPDPVVAQSQRQGVIGRIEDLVDGDDRIFAARAPGQLAGPQIRQQPWRDEARHARLHRDVDLRAAAMLAARDVGC